MIRRRQISDRQRRHRKSQAEKLRLKNCLSWRGGQATSFASLIAQEGDFPAVEIKPRRSRGLALFERHHRLARA
jgi:hypothetical protein